MQLKTITHISEGSNHFEKNFHQNGHHIKIASCIQNNSHACMGCTSPANEFLLQKCRNEFIYYYFFQIWNKLKVQLMSICYINVETKNIYIYFFHIWKNLQVQLMSFYYINVETIGKWIFLFSNLKKCTSLF